MRVFFRATLLIAWGSLLTLWCAAAEEQTVSVWLSEVEKDANVFSDSYDPGWQVLGRFASNEEAEACSLTWRHLHPKSLKMTNEREIKVPASRLKDLLETTKEAKKAVDKAKEIKKKGLTAEERKWGDTIKEYKDQIKEAFKRASHAKRELTSMTGQITLKQFHDVNKLINDF